MSPTLPTGTLNTFTFDITSESEKEFIGFSVKGGKDDYGCTIAELRAELRDVSCSVDIDLTEEIDLKS